MKKTIVTLVALSFLWSCKRENKEGVVVDNTPKLEAFNDKTTENAVIYEANIRQYSPEGSFKAFTKDIPQLKELGVKIIWVMPIFPISQTKRKATGGENSKFASEMPEAEQHKYLGSYYAVSDFTKVNPEFGTIEDFRELVKTAHDNGMYVILDWVPNHTGWDHKWITEHPEFYTKNDKGEIIDPINPETGESWGWTDVADLNYDNAELRKTMIADMKHWITNENIDGFRCDVASNVPTDFWQQAIPELRKEKNIFMLAEAWEPELLKDNLFDMCYGWEGHHLMNEMAQGKKPVTDWAKYMEKVSKEYEANDIVMNFVDNHDENSWNGTINSRLGKAREAGIALSYVMPGMPLIYSGDEYGLDHSLKFFEKDSIPKTKGNEWALLEKLGKLKNENPALAGGKSKAEYMTMLTPDNDKIIAFSRKNGGNEVVYLANFSDKEQNATVKVEGKYKDYITGKEIELKSDETMKFQPWQYFVLTN
ncbi:alpha-amylase family glycosyl hydrolase [Flavobacterium sp.]|uniref:alpha-amylase family glycosyl hydrolase n=1 Tax=Flavobacterium sp. TaxID=239 RepID=UPI0035291DD0